MNNVFVSITNMSTMGVLLNPQDAGKLVEIMSRGIPVETKYETGKASFVPDKVANRETIVRVLTMEEVTSLWSLLYPKHTISGKVEEVVNAMEEQH